MNARPFLLAFALCAACAPTPPGPQPGQTYFWLVQSSTVAFNDYCSDDMTFRMMNPPLAFNGGDNFLIYKASQDAKTATLMNCTMLDPSTCTPVSPAVVFTVAGGELSYQTEAKQQIGSTTCYQQDDTTWLLEDHVMTLDVQISDTISLVDGTTDCNRIETDIENRSPNHKGYQGCTITFAITGSAR